MNIRVDHVLQTALQLSSDERSVVAAALIDSLETSEESTITDVWRAELHRRRDDLISGKTKGELWSQVRARLSTM